MPSRPTRRPFRRRFGIRFAKLVRWLHIYLSMFSLAVVLFFSVTGITLNHPDWFYSAAEGHTDTEGQVEPKWLHPPGGSPGSESRDQADLASQVAKLEVVEHLRATHQIRGALTDFRVDENECVATFKGPGYSADAFIDRQSGHYRMTESYHGFVAVINDLHKGRDTGAVWSVLIDVSAIAMTAISLTGLVLLFYLKLKRVSGVIVVMIGAIVAIALFRLGVP
jgi:hypothetical protein